MILALLTSKTAILTTPYCKLLGALLNSNSNEQINITFNGSFRVKTLDHTYPDHLSVGLAGIRGEFIATEGNNIRKSCDDFGQFFGIYNLETTTIFETAAIDHSICRIPFIYETTVTGGNASGIDFPNEFRPVIDWETIVLNINATSSNATPLGGGGIPTLVPPPLTFDVSNITNAQLTASSGNCENGCSLLFQDFLNSIAANNYQNGATSFSLYPIQRDGSAEVTMGFTFDLVDTCPISEEIEVEAFVANTSGSATPCHNDLTPPAPLTIEASIPDIQFTLPNINLTSSTGGMLVGDITFQENASLNGTPFLPFLWLNVHSNNMSNNNLAITRVDVDGVSFNPNTIGNFLLRDVYNDAELILFYDIIDDNNDATSNCNNLHLDLNYRFKCTPKGKGVCEFDDVRVGEITIAPSELQYTASVINTNIVQTNTTTEPIEFILNDACAPITFNLALTSIGAADVENIMLSAPTPPGFTLTQLVFHIPGVTDPVIATDSGLAVFEPLLNDGWDLQELSSGEAFMLELTYQADCSRYNTTTDFSFQVTASDICGSSGPESNLTFNGLNGTYNAQVTFGEFDAATTSCTECEVVCSGDLTADMEYCNGQFETVSVSGCIGNVIYWWVIRDAATNIVVGGPLLTTTPFLDFTFPDSGDYEVGVVPICRPPNRKGQFLFDCYRTIDVNTNCDIGCDALSLATEFTNCNATFTVTNTPTAYNTGDLEYTWEIYDTSAPTSIIYTETSSVNSLAYPAMEFGESYNVAVTLSWCDTAPCNMEPPTSNVLGQCFVSDTITPSCACRDFHALVAFYNSTNGDAWLNNTDWNDATIPIGDWHGIDTNPDGCVKNLNLSNNNLTGTIPPEIGTLTELVSILLGNNQLSGSIPTEVQNLTKLQTLWLFRNQLSGPIPPQIGNLSTLTSLSLHTNQLTGCFPDTFNNLCTQLTGYNFGGNNSIYLSNSQFADAFCTDYDAYVAACDGSGKMAAPTPTISLNQEVNYKLYPNPAKEQVQLTFEATTEETITITVMDVNGKVHITQQHQTYIGRNSLSINIDALQSGYYLVKIGSEKDQQVLKLSKI